MRRQTLRYYLDFQVVSYRKSLWVVLGQWAILWFLFAMEAKSQVGEESVLSTVRKGIIYKSEWSVDAGLHTNGFYFGFNRGTIAAYHTTRTYHFDLGILYHPRESGTSKPNNLSFRSFDSYKYGKKNHLINLRVGKGIIKTYSEKARKKGVALGVQWQGGLLLGIQKPYYLKVRYEQDGRIIIRDIRYQEDPEAFLDSERIMGRSSFFNGFGHLSVVPGLFGRVALRIDPGAFEKLVRCFEMGLQLDLYAKSPDFLIINQNPNHYLNFFLNLQLGSRKSATEN